MSKSIEKEIKLDVGLPQNGLPKTLYFNRLRIDRDEGFCLVQFGLVVASDLVDSYSCVVTDDALKHNQQALIDYVKKLGRRTPTKFLGRESRLLVKQMLLMW